MQQLQKMWKHLQNFAINQKFSGTIAICKQKNYMVSLVNLAIQISDLLGECKQKFNMSKIKEN